MAAEGPDPELETEARQWIEAVTGEPLSDPDDLHASLKDGVALCNLINKIVPGSVKKIAKSSMVFKQRENISFYLKACRAFGQKEFELFGTPDLFEGTGMKQVVLQIHSLGRTVQDKLPDFEPKLGIKVTKGEKREWTEAQLADAAAATAMLNLGSSDHARDAFAAALDGTAGKTTADEKKEE